MRFTKPFGIVCLSLALIAIQSRPVAQTGDVVIKIESSTGDSVPFKAAFASGAAGLETVENVTPFEQLVAAGLSIGIIERIADGPELLVTISAGGSKSVGTGRRFVAGSNVLRGMDTFVRTF